MIADNWSSKNLYVKELYVNGKKYDKSYLIYDDIRDDKSVILDEQINNKPKNEGAVADEPVPDSFF